MQHKRGALPSQECLWATAHSVTSEVCPRISLRMVGMRWDGGTKQEAEVGGGLLRRDVISCVVMLHPTAQPPTGRGKDHKTKRSVCKWEKMMLSLYI